MNPRAAAFTTADVSAPDDAPDEEAGEYTITAEELKSLNDDGSATISCNGKPMTLTVQDEGTDESE